MSYKASLCWFLSTCTKTSWITIFRIFNHLWSLVQETICFYKYNIIIFIYYYSLFTGKVLRECVCHGLTQIVVIWLWLWIIGLLQGTLQPDTTHQAQFRPHLHSNFYTWTVVWFLVVDHRSASGKWVGETTERPMIHNQESPYGSSVKVVVGEAEIELGGLCSVAAFWL